MRRRKHIAASLPLFDALDVPLTAQPEPMPEAPKAAGKPRKQRVTAAAPKADASVDAPEMGSQEAPALRTEATREGEVGFRDGTDSLRQNEYSVPSSDGVSPSPSDTPAQAQSGLPKREIHAAIAEVLAFDLRMLALLPVPTVLGCRDVVSGCAVVLTTSREGYSRARARREAVFAPSEFEALALGAEHGRAAMRDWLKRKEREPSFEVETSMVTAGVAVHLAPRRWRIGEVFAELGLELECVQLEAGKGEIETLAMEARAV